MYNDELEYALESAYEDGYYQALADMGYEFDDEAIEDVDIFDENCFDDAAEGAAREYRRAQRRDMRESGMSDSEIDAKLRDQRMKNPSYATDPRMRPKNRDYRNMKDYDTPEGRKIRDLTNDKRYSNQMRHPIKNRNAWDKIAKARQSIDAPRYTDGDTSTPLTRDQERAARALAKLKMTGRDFDKIGASNRSK